MQIFQKPYFRLPYRNLTYIAVENSKHNTEENTFDTNEKLNMSKQSGKKHDHYAAT